MVVFYLSNTATVVPILPKHFRASLATSTSTCSTCFRIILRNIEVFGGHEDRADGDDRASAASQQPRRRTLGGCGGKNVDAR